MIYKILFTCLIIATTSSFAKGTYQEPAEFVAQAFTTQPEPQAIWVKGELREQIEDILQHKSRAKRIRYWKNKTRSVWVLEEIGKKKPITVGIIIDDNKITRLKVLVFRETRGWEVRYPFFTQQFNKISLNNDNTLSETIDGVSGATLSVRALEKLARIALMLNNTIQSQVTSK